jgi:hypothetical protein
MLTIGNIEKIKGNKIHTQHAHWVVMSIEERKHDYIIKVRFDYGITFGVKHPKYVNFKLLRYNEFSSMLNEWRLYNDQDNGYTTLTKGLLNFRIFVGILGGQLDSFSNSF